MAKDRARPFSRKHRKYWIPVTGGMILIGAINVGLGYCTYDPPTDPPQRIQLDIPPPQPSAPGVSRADPAAGPRPLAPSPALDAGVAGGSAAAPRE